MWIDQKLHFPIKTVSQGTTLELSNVKEGPQDPSPSLFQVPSGYTKTDMSTMMRGTGARHSSDPEEPYFCRAAEAPPPFLLSVTQVAALALP